MASNLPTIRRFKFEDYEGAPKWFEMFLQGLNLYVDPVYQMLSGNINYSNLVAPQLFTKIITAPASGNVTFNFTNPLKIVPSAVVLGNVYVQGNPSSHPANPVSVYWHYSQGTINIDQVTNLTASIAYVITLVIL